MELLVIVGLVAAVVVAYLGWQQADKRREALFALAGTQGLTFTRHDHVGIPSAHPFAMWRLGDERTWANVISGELAGKALLLFDFTWVDVTHNADGPDQRTKHEATCAIARLEGAFTPGLQVEPESVLSRLKDKAGFRDLELESEDFNRRFEVSCSDRRFAVAFLDPRMMNWMLTTPPQLRFEVLGQHVLVAGPKAPVEQWLLRHHIATDFANRMPDVVRSLFPL